MAEINFSEFPFSEWLESVLGEMYQISPTAIMLQMIDAEGQPYTSYWNVSGDDRAILMDAIRQDAWMSWLMANKDEIAMILSEDTDDEEEGGEEE